MPLLGACHSCLIHFCYLKAKRVGIHFFTETEFFALRDIDAVVKAVTAASAPATDSDDVISPSAVEALPSQHDVLQNIAVSGLSWDSSKQSLGPIQFAGHFANALGEFIKVGTSTAVQLATSSLTVPAC